MRLRLLIPAAVAAFATYTALVRDRDTAGLGLETDGWDPLGPYRDSPPGTQTPVETTESGAASPPPGSDDTAGALDTPQRDPDADFLEMFPRSSVTGPSVYDYLAGEPPADPVASPPSEPAPDLSTQSHREDPDAADDDERISADEPADQDETAQPIDEPAPAAVEPQFPEGQSAPAMATPEAPADRADDEATSTVATDIPAPMTGAPADATAPPLSDAPPVPSTWAWPAAPQVDRDDVSPPGVAPDDRVALDEGRFALGGWAAASGHSTVSSVTFRRRLPFPVRADQIEISVDAAENVPDDGIIVLAEPGFAPDREGFTLLLTAADPGSFSAAGSYRVLPDAAR